MAMYYHHKAMSWVDKGDKYRRENKTEKANQCYKKALHYEKKEVEKFKTKYQFEPTRSILYKSAASLAMNYKNFEEAIKLIKEALKGNAPEEIKQELAELLNACYQ